MTRPRHQKKEYETLLRMVEDAGWRVTKRPNGYFRMWCPCTVGHSKSVPLTPSSRHTHQNLVAWVKRQPCWEGGE